jgi:hypothetical protein
MPNQSGTVALPGGVGAGLQVTGSWSATTEGESAPSDSLQALRGRITSETFRKPNEIVRAPIFHD